LFADVDIGGISKDLQTMYSTVVKPVFATVTRLFIAPRNILHSSFTGSYCRYKTLYANIFADLLHVVVVHLLRLFACRRII